MHISLFYALYPSHYISPAACLFSPLPFAVDLFSIFVRLLTAANCTHNVAASDMQIPIKKPSLSHWNIKIVFKFAYFSTTKTTALIAKGIHPNASRVWCVGSGLQNWKGYRKTKKVRKQLLKVMQLRSKYFSMQVYCRRTKKEDWNQ